MADYATKADAAWKLKVERAARLTIQQDLQTFNIEDHRDQLMDKPVRHINRIFKKKTR